MLMSIYKIFWSNLLKPFRDLLRWKGISKNVMGCYFQASCLVKYSNDVILSYLIRLYLSWYHEKYDKRMTTDKAANLLSSITIDVDNFLKRSLSSNDKHLNLVVNFHILLSDFLCFVQAYRSHDSIIIENGYKLFAPIWKILGQAKHLKATWEQMDTLYRSFPYSRLQEIRINRQARTYPGSTGKLALAQDKWLELNNKEHSSYPSLQTLDSMSRQGNFIGMMQKCKRFLESVYSAGTISERTVYRSGQGAKGRGQLEKKLLSKGLHIFLGDCLPADNDLNEHRTLQPGTIASLENHLTIKLDRTKLDKETCINQGINAAGHLFNGVHHIYNTKIFTPTGWLLKMFLMFFSKKS